MIPRPLPCESNDHAWRPVFDGALKGDEGASLQARALAELAASVQGSRVSLAVVVGRDPAAVISPALRDLPRSTAVMTSRGRGRSAAVVGSVANNVLALVQDPVVVVGPRRDGPGCSMSG